MGLYVTCDYLDVTDPEHRYGLGEEPMTETRHETIGALYRALSGQDRAHPWEATGRCTGKVYIGDGQPVGWVFVSRQPYDDEPNAKGPDGKRGYLREAWVTVRTAPDTVVRTPHFASIGKG